MGKPFIHQNAIVETADIGDDTRIWAFVHILKGAKIGYGCNVCTLGETYRLHRC